MFKTLSTRLALAAVVTLASSGAMAAAIDTGKASNGLTGIFQAQTGEERALLLIDFLGRQNTVTVQMDAIA